MTVFMWSFSSMALQADFLRVSEAMLGLFCPSSMKDKDDITSHADSVYKITQQLLSPVFSRFRWPGENEEKPCL